ncbi:MAG: iron-sulfur cluster assembly scaffold protein, partial [Candidatus Pacebacteria bacterium]|nr:iron-sulfur cluster assembly scaffold protein [Candidatus Paceibacterota bacterium]
LKLNKNKIIDSLGKLPPIKIHCSVLAIDALLEAIYDYLIKNKKIIPKELKKRHQRIEKEKKIIEEKYKEWT